MAIPHPPCYTGDWQRTQPDYVVHLPAVSGQREYADHVHVVERRAGGARGAGKSTGSER